MNQWIAFDFEGINKNNQSEYKTRADFFIQHFNQLPQVAASVFEPKD